MKSLKLLLLILLYPLFGLTQNTSVKVNPNGTHTVIHHNGQTSTQINPDGSHSVIQNPKQIVEEKKLTRKEKRKLKKLEKQKHKEESKTKRVKIKK